MRFSRRLLASGPVQSLLAFLIALYIRIVGWTTRWQREGFEAPLALRAQRRPFILCFWHGRLAAMPHCDPDRSDIAVLISGHRDGRLIARTVHRLGIGTIEGSSSRGAEAGLIESARHLRRGGMMAITPDGPRGPRMRAAAGAVKLAALSGAPIYPVSFATSRLRVLGSWDRFLLPWPFGRGLIQIGNAITVASNADSAALEAARLELEQQLNHLSADCDRRMGHVPIEPAVALVKVEPTR
jgi:lysophospholipid acyltransferase (LPLAT)-like uncharacterized protein